MILRLLVFVLVKCTAFSIVERDRSLISEMLGYVPSNLYGIPARTTNGEPLVLQTYPIKNGHPFPTLYWLCHKDVARAIADLERRGLGKRIEATIMADPALLQQQVEAHIEYAETRWMSLSVADRNALALGRQREMIHHSGIAGANITNDSSPPSIKCLHAHYAHYRVSSNNPVGEHVHKLLQEQFPLLIL